MIALACAILSSVWRQLAFCITTNFLTNRNRCSVSTLCPMDVEASTVETVIERPRRDAGSKVSGYSVIRKR